MDKIGIIVAMREEVIAMKRKMIVKTDEEYAGMTFSIGTLDEKEIIMVQSDAGSINTALCTQILISVYGVECVINTGLAGGLSPDVKIGELIMASDCEKNVDAPQFQAMNQQLVDRSLSIAKGLEYKENILHGRIISKDEFDARVLIEQDVSTTFTAYCAEIEIAAIGYTCYLNKVPFLIIRCISDTANDEIDTNYQDFTQQISRVTMQIIQKLIRSV